MHFSLSTIYKLQKLAKDAQEKISNCVKHVYLNDNDIVKLN